MHHPNVVSRSLDAELTEGWRGDRKPVDQTAGHPAAQGPRVEAISAAENPVGLGKNAAGKSAVRGRRVLSTAFVMIGPDGYLTVELADGQELILREVVMHRDNYCGVRIVGGKASGQYCGDYATVAGARAGEASIRP